MSFVFHWSVNWLHTLFVNTSQAYPNLFAIFEKFCQVQLFAILNYIELCSYFSSSSHFCKRTFGKHLGLANVCLQIPTLSGGSDGNKTLLFASS